MKAKIIIILSFILSANVFCQPTIKNHLVDDEVFFVNIIVTPSYYPSAINIYVFYTFSYSGIVFQKTDNNKYYAIPEIEVTFKDSEGITRKRFISNDTILVDDYESTQKKIYFSNSTEFELAKDDYKVVAKFNNSKTRTSPIEHTISKPLGDNMFILTDRSSNKGRDTLYVPYSTNCVPYNASSFDIFIPHGMGKYEYRDYIYIPQINNIKCVIEKKEYSKNELNWGTFEKIETSFNLSEYDIVYGPPKGRIVVLGGNDYIVACLNAKFQIDSHNFTPGKYTLSVVRNEEIVKQFPFEVKWYNMPKSLSDPIYALEQMHLILTDDEYKNMKSKDKNEVFANIIKYWNSRIIGVPKGNYSTEMVEFFDRVDYAEINFRTLTQKEGAKSDRGKVYILNGNPNEITTTIKDKKTNEIWYYNKLNKKYIFEIVSVGNYQLVNIEE
ncbi:MAG: GWxTD domain-containing protein [Bacteroidetes bacterium]|nr:GWxTD domain-containing protein [Bacteroidota bacterium]